MHLSTTLLAGAMAMSVSAETNYLGFNSGATLADRSAKFKKDFVDEMKAAQGLEGAPGTFNSVRLYTNIQAYSQDDPIQAFEAAIETKTKLLLGIWTSGTDNIDKEISALQKAVKKYGSEFTKLVIGMSVGSEDLYRDSVTGVKNKAGVGNSPDAIIKFIGDFKKAFKDTPLGNVPVGHVDTWDAWTNSSVKSVIDAVDWVGVDEYPFYESGKSNNIKNAGNLFDRAYEATINAVGGKPVWVTETGWPTTGPDWDEAVASVENAKFYWDEVGCRQLFNKVPTFWYNMRDSNPDNKVKFAITKDLSTKPLFDLTCPKTFKTKPRASSVVSSAASTATGTTNGTADGTATATGASKPTSTGTSGNSGSDGSSGSGNHADSKAGSDSGSGTSAPAAASSTTAKGASSTVEKFSGAAYLALAILAGSMTLL